LSFGDGSLQLHLAIAEVFRRDMAEYVRGHHAHRPSPEDLLGERAGGIAEDNLFLVFLDDEKVALNGGFSTDSSRF
jgi:hypothetical protein